MTGRAPFYFGPWKLGFGEIFYNTSLSLALVNYKPVVPGHVLIIPRRVVKRFDELTAEEVTDMFLTAKAVGRVVEREYGAESLTMTIQDGAAAGQTVEHVHVHILPRKKGDYLDNNDIYDDINLSSRELLRERKAAKNGGVSGPDAEANRVERTKDDMAAESARLRVFFESHEDIWS